MKRLLPRFGIILITLGLGLMAFSLGHLFLGEKKYAATARIAIEKGSTDVGSLVPERNRDNYDPYWIQTEFEKIQSKAVLFQVISNLNARQAWSGNSRRPEPVEVTYRWLRDRMLVSQYRNTSLFEIRVESPDPVEAATVANEIAQVFAAWSLTRHQQLVQSGLEMLQKEWEKIQNQIQDKEAALQSLKADAAESTPNRQAQEELANLTLVRDRLQLRIAQEKGDGPPPGPVRIIDLAQVPVRPRSPKTALSLVGSLTGFFCLFLGICLRFIR